MNNIILQTSINWTKNLTENPLKYFFYSYGEVIGLDIFFTFLFGVIAMAIFVHSNRNIPITVGFFLLVQIFMVAALPSAFTIIVFIIAALMSAGVAYNAYFKEK